MFTSSIWNWLVWVWSMCGLTRVSSTSNQPAPLRETGCTKVWNGSATRCAKPATINSLPIPPRKKPDKARICPPTASTLASVWADSTCNHLGKNTSASTQYLHRERGKVGRQWSATAMYSRHSLQPSEVFTNGRNGRGDLILLVCRAHWVEWAT